VLLEVGSESVDTVRDQGDLNFGGSGICGGLAESLNEVRFLGFDFGLTSFTHLHAV
jgi:hypothetical protein